VTDYAAPPPGAAPMGGPMEDQDQSRDADATERRQRILLTPASAIKPRRVRWLWDGRVAYGTLALLAGREGLGKSTLAYQVAADITRGELDGEDKGNPRAVIICASEDSWEHTIVPRLIAAGADLDKVFRVEIATHDDVNRGLSLPKDFLEVAWAAEQTGAGLLVLDPLMSIIDTKLDTHRDRELRQALEPLAKLADRSRMAVLGLIHHNKSGSTDALQLVMGSKAFTAVARSVHTCITDPDDDTQARRLFATSKNNLGRLDLPVLGFTITGHAVETEDDGTAWTGRLNWTGEVEGNMHELMTRSADPERGATSEAAEWLRGYLSEHGGEHDKVSIEKAGRASGHTSRTLQRAAKRLDVKYSSAGYPRRSYWALPGAVDHAASSRANEDDDPSRANPAGATAPVAPTLPGTDPDEHSRAQSRQPTAPLGATAPDLHKQPDPHARAGARTRGDTPVGATEKNNPSHTPTTTVAPTAPTTPRAHTHDPHQVPTCPDCHWPIDNQNHQTVCEDPTWTA